MYKAVKDDKIVDAYDQLYFVKYDKKAKMFLRCSEEDNPQGIIQRNGIKIYHVKDWEDIPKEAGNYETIVLEEITNKSAYDGIITALNQEQEVSNNAEDARENVMDLEFIRSGKIKEMSNECDQIITRGLDLELNAVKGHFSFTEQNQMYINLLAVRANNGDTLLPYHADDEVDTIFSKEDIVKLKEAMDYHVMHHRVYLNSLQIYINSTKDIDELNNVTYGVNIPEEFRSEVLNQLG